MERGFLGIKDVGVVMVGGNGTAGTELEGLGEATVEGVGA